VTAHSILPAVNENNMSL